MQSEFLIRIMLKQRFFLEKGGGNSAKLKKFGRICCSEFMEPATKSLVFNILSLLALPGCIRDKIPLLWLRLVLLLLVYRPRFVSSQGDSLSAILYQHLSRKRCLGNPCAFECFYNIGSTNDGSLLLLPD